MRTAFRFNYATQIIRLLKAQAELERLDKATGPDALRLLLTWLKKDGPLDQADGFDGRVAAALIRRSLGRVEQLLRGGRLLPECKLADDLRTLSGEILAWMKSTHPSGQPSARQTGTEGAKMLLRGNRCIKRIISAMGSHIATWERLNALSNSAQDTKANHNCDAEPEDCASLAQEDELESMGPVSDEPPQRGEIRWVKTRRKLYHHDKPIRDYNKRSAKNQMTILDEFEAAGWVAEINIESLGGLSIEQAKEAVASFNKKVKPGTIKLCMDGTGKGIFWRDDM